MANETPDDERELRIAALMDYYGASDDEPSGVRLSDDALEQVRDAVREEINAGMDRAGVEGHRGPACRAGRDAAFLVDPCAPVGLWWDAPQPKRGTAMRYSQGRGLSLLIAGVLAPGAAGALDLTGKWRFTGLGSPQILQVTQSGSSLSFGIFTGTVTPGGPFATYSVGFSSPPLQAGIGGRIMPSENLLDGRSVFSSGPGMFQLGAVVATRCTCDDGNALDGDGCNAECRVEPCWVCTGDPSVCTPASHGSGCEDGNACTTGETCSAGACGGGAPVAPCVDMNGPWSQHRDVLGVGSFDFVTDFVQRGTDLIVGEYVGTIDPATGAFDLRSVNLDLFCPDFDPLVGTVAPDGATYTATGIDWVVDPNLGDVCDPFSLVECGSTTLDPPIGACPTTTTSTTTTTTIATGAADQLVLGDQFILFNPGPPQLRTAVAEAEERNSTATVVGDPRLPGSAGGAILTLIANGASPSSQSFALPQGTTSSGPLAGQPFWRAITGGFRYRDLRGEQGPVTQVVIRRTSGGRFEIESAVLGLNGPLAVVPPNPGTDAFMTLKLGLAPAAGDRYCVQYGPESQITNTGPFFFRARNPVLKGCPGAPTTSTTSSSTTSTTSSTTSSTTTTTTATTTSTTTTTPGFVCCVLAPDLVPRCHHAAFPASASECASIGGTPGPPGTVCDASGACVEPPGAPGDCCQALDGRGCVIPVDSVTCTESGGQLFHENAVCTPQGTCVP
jgi:cysteine-rich repeat protein